MRYYWYFHLKNFLIFSPGFFAFWLGKMFAMINFEEVSFGAAKSRSASALEIALPKHLIQTFSLVVDVTKKPPWWLTQPKKKKKHASAEGSPPTTKKHQKLSSSLPGQQHPRSIFFIPGSCKIKSVPPLSWSICSNLRNATCSNSCGEATTYRKYVVWSGRWLSYISLKGGKSSKGSHEKLTSSSSG